MDRPATPVRSGGHSHRPQTAPVVGSTDRADPRRTGTHTRASVRHMLDTAGCRSQGGASRRGPLHSRRIDQRRLASSSRHRTEPCRGAVRLDEPHRRCTSSPSSSRLRTSGTRPSDRLRHPGTGQSVDRDRSTDIGTDDHGRPRDGKQGTCRESRRRSCSSCRPRDSTATSSTTPENGMTSS